MPRVFKTKNPPPQIVGFGKDATEASQYAHKLNDYQKTASSKKITVSVFGKFDVSAYEWANTGWMIHHKDETKKNNFISYIVSAQQNWAEFQKTIDTTLAYFMRGYDKAYHDISVKETSTSMSAPQTWEQPNEKDYSKLRESFAPIIQSLIEKGAERSQEIQRICENNPYRILLLRADIYEKRLDEEKKNGNKSRFYLALGDMQASIDNIISEIYEKRLNEKKPSLQDSLHVVRMTPGYETGTAAQREKFDKSTFTEKYKTLAEHFASVMKNPIVYLQRLHEFSHGWGGNNCLFLALSAHPDLFQEVVDLLWGTAAEKPNVKFTKQIAAAFPSLGGQLRQKFIKWLNTNKKQQLYVDLETGKDRTIEDFIVGLNPQALNIRQKTQNQDSANTTIFEDYINREMAGTSLLAAELYDILSICLKRRIFSVTGPYGSYNAYLLQFQSPILNQITVDWRQDAPDIYVLTQPNVHHWATTTHFVS